MAISVKLMLISLAAVLLCVGMLATATGNNPQTPRDSGNNVTVGLQKPPAPANNTGGNNTVSNFFAPLRFWEKNKSQPPPRQPHPVANTPAEARNVPHPVTAEQVVNVAPQRPTTPGMAPEPPPIPLGEQRGGSRNAPLPEWSANLAHDTNEKRMPSPQDGRLTTASHVSYSFDARDWVDSFPHQHANRQPEVFQPAVTQQVPQQTAQDVSVGVIQTTSFHTAHQSPVQPPIQRAPEQFSPPQTWENVQTVGEESGYSYWDGQATKLANVASIRSELDRMQQDRPAPAPAVAPVAVPAPAVAPTATAFVPTVAPPVAGARIDLTPSYSSRLPYTQTCGVVIVQANFPLTEIAAILEEIDMLQRDLTRNIGVPAPQEKIELCLFKDQKSYMDFLSEFFPKAPRNRRALYVKLDKKPGTLMVQKSKDFEVDLRHEMTHAIVHASIPRVPIWLDEGLAKYFEVPPQDRHSNHPYMREIRRSTGLGMIPSLERLAKMENIDDMDTKEYRESWAWTHFMIHRTPETHRLLAAYLQMLATHPGEVETGSNLVSAVFAGVRRQSVPSLKLYLDDMMPNQREAFKEHFGQ